VRPALDTRQRDAAGTATGTVALHRKHENKSILKQIAGKMP